MTVDAFAWVENRWMGAVNLDKQTSFNTCQGPNIGCLTLLRGSCGGPVQDDWDLGLESSVCFLLENTKTKIKKTAN